MYMIFALLATFVTLTFTAGVAGAQNDITTVSAISTEVTPSKVQALEEVVEMAAKMLWHNGNISDELLDELGQKLAIAKAGTLYTPAVTAQMRSGHIVECVVQKEFTGQCLSDITVMFPFDKEPQPIHIMALAEAFLSHNQ